MISNKFSKLYLTTPEEYYESVYNSAIELANKCNNSWRNHNSQQYSYQQIIQSNKSKKCNKCNMTCYIIDNDFNNIHSNFGDFENHKEVYLAEKLLQPIIKMNNKDIIITYHDINKSKITITEQEVIDAIEYIIELFPNIKAWITLKHLQYALCLEWFELLNYLLEIIEKRNLYFTPSGFYYNFSKNYENIFRRRNYGQFIPLYHNIPIEHTEGEYNIPLYLKWEDNYASTINNDTTIRYILDKYSKVINYNRIYNLCKRFSANTQQWLIHECESFHRNEQCKVIRMLVHKIENENTKKKLHEPYDYIWHTELTNCKLCNDSKIETIYSTDSTNLDNYLLYTDMKLTKYDVKNKYEMFIYDTMMLRRKRLRGILYCAAVLVGKARLIKFLPGVGSKYFEAMRNFEESKEFI